MKQIYLIFFLLLFFGHSTAQIPRTISYQGDLRNAKGGAIPDGEHTFVFSLYSTSYGGFKLFSETHTVDVTGGIFTVIIGSITPISASLSFDSAYYLGIAIDGGLELIPRTAFTSAAYALHASVASALSADAYIPPGLILGSTAPAGPALGDLWGTYPYPSVIGLQSRPISPVLPQRGDVFIWNGGTWGPGTPPPPVAFHVGGTNMTSGAIEFSLFSGSVYFTDGEYFDTAVFAVPQTGVYRFDLYIAATIGSSYYTIPQYTDVTVSTNVDGSNLDSKEFRQMTDPNQYSSYPPVNIQYSSLLKLKAGQRVKFIFYPGEIETIGSIAADLTGFKLK